MRRVFPIKILAPSISGILTPWGTPKSPEAVKQGKIVDVGPGDNIQAAIDSLTAGGTVVFAPGVYTKTTNWIVRPNDVTLWGYGAKIVNVATPEQLVASTKDTFDINKCVRQCLRLDGTNSAIYGFDIESTNQRQRLYGACSFNPMQICFGDWVMANDGVTPPIRGRGVRVMDNRVAYGHGIFGRLASDFVVKNNVVRRSLADAIHITGKTSRRGELCYNLCEENGDDQLVLCNYASGRPQMLDMKIHHNRVRDNYWARGIAILGAERVQVYDNEVDNTTRAPGIFVWGDISWGTADNYDVVVERNKVSRTQTNDFKWAPAQWPKTPPYPSWYSGPRNPSHFGAITVRCDAPRKARGITLRNNEIDTSAYSGIGLFGDVEGLTITGNKFTNITGPQIRDERLVKAAY